MGPLLDQETRFCTAPDGVRIACATTGQGLPLVKAANWLSHLQFDLESPVWVHWIRELSRHHLFVRYDERGCGLSDWNVQNFTFDSWVRDLETVIDSLQLDHFSLLGISQGGPVSIAYAVRHPNKVDRLILYGAYARGWARRNLPPEGLEETMAAITLMRTAWGKDNPSARAVFTSHFIPDAKLAEIRSFNNLQRVSTSPENATRFMDVFGKIDVHDLAPKVSVPTLILHTRDDVAVPFESGRELAGLIPNSRFVPLEGNNHILLEDDQGWKMFVQEVRRFLGVKDVPSQQLRSKKELGMLGWMKGPKGKGTAEEG